MTLFCKETATAVVWAVNDTQGIDVNIARHRFTAEWSPDRYAIAHKGPTSRHDDSFIVAREWVHGGPKQPYQAINTVIRGWRVMCSTSAAFVAYRKEQNGGVDKKTRFEELGESLAKADKARTS